MDPLLKAEPSEAMISIGTSVLRGLLRDGIISRDTPYTHLRMIVAEIYRSMVKELA